MKKHIIPIMAAVLLMSGCTSVKPLAVTALEGKWNIVSVDGKAVTPGSSEKAPYLAFDVVNGHVSGNAGCNSITGTFPVNQPDGKIDLTRIGTTMMACPDMTLEQSITAALANTTGFSRAGNNEIALVSGNRKVMVLRRTAPDFSINTLTGKWNIAELNDKPLKPTADAVYTMTFDSSGKFFCETGCNNLSGNFKTGYTDIRFGDVLSTRMSCPDMSVEQTLSQLLPQVVSYGRLADNSLGFYDAQGNMLMRLSR